MKALVMASESQSKPPHYINDYGHWSQLLGCAHTPFEWQMCAATVKTLALYGVCEDNTALPLDPVVHSDVDAETGQRCVRAVWRVTSPVSGDKHIHSVMFRHDGTGVVRSSAFEPGSWSVSSAPEAVECLMAIMNTPC